MTTQTYAERLKVIEQMRFAAENYITISVVPINDQGQPSLNIESMLLVRKRTAEAYFLADTDMENLKETMIEQFLYINDNIKRVIGL